MTEKRWTFKPLPSPESIEKLSKEISTNATLSALLLQRGVSDYESAQAFFVPDLASLHDPFLMADMSKAVERLQNAIENGEKILIYGDYDVDGTTAVALVYGFLSSFYPNLEYYNPDRYEEGYGVSFQGIDWAASQGVSLMIALDCGIKAHEKVVYAKEKYNIDFIICDHHEPDATLPEAVAVLDPKRKDCPYPYKELTGNGVGFKLLQAFCEVTGREMAGLEEFLDLCMVSIASDIVPITGENRILAYFGLKKINERPSIGLKALKTVAGFHSNMTIENVVFVIGPRINAAGRIKHAKAAVQLLLATDYYEAESFAKEIHEHNNYRRGLDKQITKEALEMIQSDDWMLETAKSTVLYKEDWHKGVIGIVASRCIEKFHRPTIILTKSHDKAAGSARSVPGFDLYQAIDQCSDFLEQFGGHTHAAGMTLPIENIDAFRLAFDKVVSENMPEELRVPTIIVDMKIPLDAINDRFYRIINRMAPFGPQNMQPVFVSENLTLKSINIMKDIHLKIEVLDENTGISFVAIGFGMVEDFLEKLQDNKYFSIAYQVEQNTFRDRTSLQLMLKDIKF